MWVLVRMPGRMPVRMWVLVRMLVRMWVLVRRGLRPAEQQSRE
jgi:hypothetical protein